MPDTIAAIATGGGISAIGIVRLSGDGAITAADKVFRTVSGVRMADAVPRKLYYGELTGADGEVADICMCTISRGPASYTGEDTAEFHCHGSPVVLSEALRALFAHGVRQALPGEFTRRAYLNGRLDLTQAEAVIDLIEAETSRAAQNAAGQLMGSVRLMTDAVYHKLLDIMAHFHAVIDYPDEDIDEFQVKSHIAVLKSAETELSALLDTFGRGRILREGISTVIAGRPNTGKSSLLNALLGYDRAIVTDVPGTTRDTIEERINIGGLLLRVADTAGIRETGDTVEKLGVERSVNALGGAGLALVVLDGSMPLCEEDLFVIRSVPREIPVLAVINKSDLPQRLSGEDIEKLKMPHCSVSAVTGEGLPRLSETVRSLFPAHCAPPRGELISNARQADAISRAKDSVLRAKDAIADSVTPDAALTEIEAALHAIGEITGKTMREDITTRIFERFCVGK